MNPGDRTLKVYPVLVTVLACMFVVVSSGIVCTGYAATAREIDVSVDVSLERFYKEVKGAGEFARLQLQK